jgi:hypothetical protein
MMVPMNNKPMINVITDMTRSALPGSVKYTNAADSNVIVVAIRNQACPALGFMKLHQVTGYVTAPIALFERWHDFFAHLACKERAAGMERATCW